jgi:cyanophycinase
VAQDERPAGTSQPGTLLIIGGAEDKQDGREILGWLAQRVKGRCLVIVTVATEDPEASWQKYRAVFADLGVNDLAHVDVRDRLEGLDPERSAAIEDAEAVFFTGGDQLRITANIGDTFVYRRTRNLLGRGGVVAGTSAGASVMSETMLVGGSSSNTPTVGEIARMAPGLGFLPGTIVDQHFSERGRMGRLVGAVAQNPRVLGIGVDEDTAALVEGGCLSVLGSGAVYVIDGAEAGRSNIAEGTPDETLTIEDVRLHVLADGRQFDLTSRRPV